MPTIMPWCQGHPTMEGKTAWGASSPVKLTLHMPEPVVDHERGNIIIHGEQLRCPPAVKMEQRRERPVLVGRTQTCVDIQWKLQKDSRD